MARPEQVLRVGQASMSFSRRRVLNAVDLVVGSGSVHGLVGNNGAGKSTLVKIISGIYTPEAGSRIEIKGAQVPQPFDAHIAHALGLRVVHQEAPLLDTFTVAEMVGIFHGYPTKFGRIRWGALHRETEYLLERFSIPIKPDARTALLSAGERALVALAVALADVEDTAFSPMLILDEATASVPAREAVPYLDTVRRVASLGGGILMVSHRLQEIVDYCDQITILSDGNVVYRGPTADVTPRILTEYMNGSEDSAGRSIQAAPAKLPATWGFGGAVSPQAENPVPLLKADDIWGEVARGISFSVAPGEIVGMGGLFGSGASEVARIVAGVVPATRGSVQLEGDSAPLDLRGRPYAALESGVAYLSSDRAHEGGIPTLSLQENTFLPTVREYWAKRALERRRMTEALDLLTVRPPIPGLSFGLLSGGNQQKVLLAKLLLTSPRLLVLDDPTVGVDSQSREAIFAVIQEVVRTGRGALVVSSEPDQLARICDRILVIANGTIVNELVGEEVENAEVAIAGAG